jgi:TolB-like protein
MTAALAMVLAASPIAVSVLPFDNRTGDARYDVMEKGLSDMLLTDLASAEGLAVVERSRLADVIAEQKLQRSALFDPATALKLGKLAGATHIVTGSLLKADPELRLDVRLVDVQSGRVLFGDKVVGASDRLFELEQSLVTRFLDGLGQKGVLPARSGPSKVSTLLAYAQAVDRADQGDLKQASQAMAAVMKSDSDFRLAKERYTDLLKRLHDASARRTEILTEGQKELGARIDTALASPPDLDNAKESALETHLGYRALAMNLQLVKLRAIAGKDCLPALQNASVWALVRKKQREAAREVLRAYFDAALKFLADADRINTKKGRHLEGGHTADSERAIELGLGDHPDRWDHEFHARLHLATFIFSGAHWNYGVMRNLAPAPAELDPNLAEPALKLFEEAAALAERESNPHEKLERASRVAMEHGDALLALGRREDALARWQAALDAMPTAPHFKNIEERMEKALGTHDTWKALDASLKQHCSPQTGTAMSAAAFALLPFDPKGLFDRAEKMAVACKDSDQPWLRAGGFMWLGHAATRTGNCPVLLRALEGAKKIAPDIAATLESEGKPCLEDL